MKDLKTINEQILELNKQKDAILHDKYKDQRDLLLKLDWLKNAWKLFREGFGPYSTEYAIIGILPDEVKNALDSANHITLKGDSKQYYENITIIKDWTLDALTFKIYTCNAELFCEFCKEHNIKIKLESDFDKKLMVYQTLNELRK